MPNGHGRLRIPYARWVAAAAGLLLCLGLAAPDLIVKRTEDGLYVTAPRLNFLTGKPLERLHNGQAVAFDFQLSVVGQSKTDVLRRGFERFNISWDLWEEKFSVTRMRSSRSSVTRLSSQAAEAWCLDNITFPASGLPLDQLVYVRLEVRAQEPKESLALADEPGISIANLIEMFSRASKARQPQYWKLEAGPLRLGDLKATAARNGS